MDFLGGVQCDLCGAGLPGASDGFAAICDDCMATERPWERGRAALSYGGAARRLVLGLKHGDRTDLVPPAARWMARAGGDLFGGDPLLVPVPIHWTRLFRRRYNQSAELARAIARIAGLQVAPDLLIRHRATPLLDGLGAEARHARLRDAIAPKPRKKEGLRGRDIVLVDDVMTSGATLAACSRACHAAGARRVAVLVLARVGKRP